MIGNDLLAGGELSWVANAYRLPLSALLLIGGAAGDLYGRRPLLVLGIALFAVSSTLCAADQASSGWLPAARRRAPEQLR